MHGLAVAAIAAACVTLAMTDATPKAVKTASGLVSGTAGRNPAISVFKGIPFAAPRANFGATGNPNGKGLPPWPAVTREVPQTMEVGDAFRPIPIAGTPARIAFFLQ